MEPQKPGNFLGPGPEVVETENCKRASGAESVASWTVQNEMRDVLGRVSASAASATRRILDSANPSEIIT